MTGHVINQLNTYLAPYFAERRAKLVSRSLREVAVLQIGQLRAELIEQFFDRVRNNDIDAVLRMLLQDPALVRSTTVADGHRKWAGCTPLHYAAAHGHIEIARELLLHGSDIEARSADHLALGWSSMPSEKNHGRENECEMCHGETPLHAAVSFAMGGMVAFLLDEGASIEAEDSQGHTPLALACAEGSGWETTVKLLLDRGADPNHTWDDKCALWYATLQGSEDLVRCLLAKGANPHWRSREGETLLFTAASLSGVEVATALLEAGVDPAARSIKGETALHEACTLGEFVEQRLEGPLRHDSGFATWFGSAEEIPEMPRKPREASSEYHRRLDLAGYILSGVRGESQVFYRHNFAGLGMVNLLVDRGADVNAVDEKGETPLHRAAHYGRRAAAGVLLAHGAEVNRRNRKGQTAADIADVCHMDALARWLRTLGLAPASFGVEVKN